LALDLSAIRARFPALSQMVEGGEHPVFLDNPAGTQVPQEVISAVTGYYTHDNANSGGLFATSQRTDAMVRGVRQKLAAFLNAPSADEIVLGQNMTTLNFSLSRALAKTLKPGDEIVLTRMDHDANVAPWLRIAEDYGLTVRWADIHTEDATLDLDSLEAALTNRTKIVATVHASNAVGTINPVQQIAGMAHAAGALYVVDAVQSAPHVVIDVQAIGCDFLLCSAYKFFGPHIGVLWGRYDLLANLPAYKVRPSKDKPPYRWETGTPSFETIAGTGGAMDYLAWVGRTFGKPADSTLRAELVAGMTEIAAYERELAAYLIDMLSRLPGVKIHGITDPARMHERVPTVAFVKDGCASGAVAEHLGKNDIYVWDGNYYAVEIVKRLGHEQDGMVRIGPTHYNTREEIDRLETALKKL
jgi:cysteine desulfurase family protein (TIGR01976 family)